MSEHATGKEVQNVFIYCESSDEAENITTFCHQSRQLKRIPEVVKLPTECASWQGLLKLMVHQLPPPYAPHEWSAFWEDADALISASLLSLGKSDVVKTTGFLEDMRWPSVLVTDRKKLVQASAELSSVFAEASGLRVSDLLPVVLAADFKMLSGFLIADPPINVSTSTVLRGDPNLQKVEQPNLQSVESGGLQKSLPSPAPMQDLESTAGSIATLVSTASPSKSRSPLKKSKVAWSTVHTGPSDTEMEQPSKYVSLSPGVYVQNLKSCSKMEQDRNAARVGTRCLAIFTDRQCAYAAVSTDGIRCVQAQGVWEVINGQIVLGGTSGNAEVRHIRLATEASNWEVLSDAYEEPIHLDLEDISLFDAPVSLAECVPRVGESLRADLLKVRGERDRHCEDLRTLRTTSTRNPGMPGGLVGKTLHQTTTLPDPAMQEPVRDKMARASIAAAASNMMQLTPRQEVLSSNAEQGQSSARAASPADMAKPFLVCSLKPGKYTYQRGIPGSEEYGELQITLHADSTFEFCERRFNAVLELAHKRPHWYVESGALVLTSRDSDAYPFVLRRQRGKKDVEQRIQRLELPVATVRERCVFMAFSQQTNLFPGHKLIDESERIGGLIDPASPALLDPPAELDRIPLHRFEGCLLERGLRCDEFVSDISSMDKNQDGTLDAYDISQLKTYGEAVASPEQMSAFREALLRMYGTLKEAFDTCKLTAATMAAEALMEEEAAQESHEEPSVARRDSTGRRDSTARRDSTGGVSRNPSKSKLARQGSKGTAPPPDEKPPARKSISGKSANGPPPGVSFEVFERFLQDSASGKGRANSGPLRSWLKSTTPQDVQAIWRSINPNRNPTVELVDFLSLSLHTAMASIRRLDHFQSWIFERFGREPEAFARAFHTLVPKGPKLKDRDFVARTAQLGYPCGPKVTHCIFGLLDRNFKGAITMEEWNMFRDFSSERLLQSLEDLKKFSEEVFGGIDLCFERLLEREKIVKSMPGKATHVSFKTFSKACDEGGFTKKFANVDLEMLFIFLDEASDQACNGYINYGDWQLLHGFEARAITGSPARLRRFLENEFETVDEAWKQLIATWATQLVKVRIDQLALSSLVRALIEASQLGKAGQLRSNYDKAWKNVETAVSNVSTMATGSKLPGNDVKEQIPSINQRPADGGAALAAVALTSKMKGTAPLAAIAGKCAAESWSEGQEKQRPHTHEGARTRGLLGMDTPQRMNFRFPGRSNKAIPGLGHTPPSLPAQLRTELWELEALPQSVDRQRPAQSAPSSDQKAAGRRPQLPGIFLASKYAEQRCKLQVVEHGLTPGLSARLSPMASPGRKLVGALPAPMPLSARGFSRSGAVSAINWEML